MRIFIVAFLMALVAGCTSGGWRVVEGEEFYIEFPGPPVDTATMVGDAAGARLYYEPQDGGLDSNAYYSLSTYMLSDSAEKMGDLLDDIMLKDAEIYAWSMGAILADSGKVVNNNGTVGREYQIFMNRNAGVITMRKYYRGKNLYTLVVITGNQFLGNSYIYRFLNSFKFKEAKKPK